MVRFLHTADWQLGMTLWYLQRGNEGDGGRTDVGEAQARYSQDRLDAIRRIGDVARREKCQFIVVAGDIFEFPRVSSRVLLRTFEACQEVGLPIYMLPGNHDPLVGGGVYASEPFLARKPEDVHVLTDTAPVEVAPGVQLVGAPWPNKHPPVDLVAEAFASLPPAEGLVRIGIAHGWMRRFVPGARAEDLPKEGEIREEVLDQLLSTGRLHYLALGDRHSATKVRPDSRAWYSGTTEPTALDEERPCQCLVVEVSDQGKRVTVNEHQVGRWRFVKEERVLGNDQDVDVVLRTLKDLPNKDRTVVKLALSGTLSMAALRRLEEGLAAARATLAALWGEGEARVLPDPRKEDLQALNLTGFARAALDRLSKEAATPGGNSETAREALALLYRITVTATGPQRPPGGTA